MLNTRKLSSGQKETKRLHERYGGRLLCVGYRRYTAQGKRFKTVELIIEEASWQPLME